jgi:hypothetical protein
VCLDFVIHRAIAKTGSAPKTIVIGALGRCGQGALEFASKIGLLEHVSKWDLEETKKGGPFAEILDHDIMLNCIYLMTKIPPFITQEMIKDSTTRKLSVVVDVSCDASNPNNPLPIYDRYVPATFRWEISMVIGTLTNARLFSNRAERQPSRTRCSALSMVISLSMLLPLTTYRHWCLRSPAESSLVS